MDVVTILIAVGETLFKLYPAVEKYGPQVITDIKQDWDTLTVLAKNGGAITPEFHDQVMANLDRAHTLFQQNTADVDVT